MQILPLAQADLAGLEALFDEQCNEWLRLLKWDYTIPSRLIRQVARQRELSGFVAMSGSATIGFSYYVVESGRCSVGDIYVSKEARGVGADRLMAAAILEKLSHLPRVRRIESQCVGVDNEGANELFKAQGFKQFDRYYMMAGLAALDRSIFQRSEDLSAPLPGLTIRAWEEDDFTQAARIIHRSYRGQHDSRINSQYATEEGCAELLMILTDQIWCGDFLPQVSRVAVRPATDNQVGVLIASCIAEGMGHIGQISILPTYQGLGLGRRMIYGALSDFYERGFNSVSLAVTSANAAALHLYESCGFRTIHTFPVFFRDKK
ncbi:MAG TPA: GNAT family N-acetyltransferase [Blastocatellia bacterium]